MSTMSAQKNISPSRQYRVIMMTEDAEQVVEIVTLPATLVNNSATVEVWYQKHVPEGHLIIEIEPVESVPEEVVEEEPPLKSLIEEDEEPSERAYVAFESLKSLPEEDVDDGVSTDNESDDSSKADL